MYIVEAQVKRASEEDGGGRGCGADGSVGGFRAPSACGFSTV